MMDYGRIRCDGTRTAPSEIERIVVRRDVSVYGKVYRSSTFVAGRCPLCLKVIGLMDDGKLRPHTVVLTNDTIEQIPR